MILASICLARTPDEAAQDLAKFGIMGGFPDGTFRLEENVTRAQTAKMIMAAFGREDIDIGNAVFTDVPNHHWAKNYITFAYYDDVIGGFPDGTFRPEDKVTKYQAIKMVICMLKYDKLRTSDWRYAETTGDTLKYPKDYLDIASSYGLVSKEEVGDHDATASRGFLAQLISTALDMPIAECVGIQEKGFSMVDVYAPMDGKNGNPLKTLRSELEK